MKKIMNLFVRLKALTSAGSRFPATLAFSVAAAVILGISISSDRAHPKLMLTCAVGALLCAALQMIYERFFNKLIIRIALMAGGVLLTMLYYLTIRQVSEISIEIGVRTAVALLALFIAFIWCPVIKSKVSFNESFISVFKAFFHTLLYAGVAFMGCGLIIAATNALIFEVGDKTVMHTANIIYVLLSPIFFLSLIPVYPGRAEATEAEEAAEVSVAAGKTEAAEAVGTSEVGRRETHANEKLQHAISVPKFLAILIEFIIIPLTLAFTVILIIYIVLNIRGEFWTNNLLEPMLVSYSITVILVYILSSTLESRFAKIFRKIFPKVLVPIVVFQIAASVLTLGDTGVTHTRYFVILFGIFAAASGIVMSIVPVKKNGIIAILFLVFSLVSMIPPIDAFTMSRISQVNRLENALIRNNMLIDNEIITNSEISEADKQEIALAVQYLDRMDYISSIEWMPENFKAYQNFYFVFGFNQYEAVKKEYRNVNVFLKSGYAIDIQGNDFLAQSYVSDMGDKDLSICSFVHDATTYTLKKEISGDNYVIILADLSGNKIISFDTKEIFSRFSNKAVEYSEMTQEEATFIQENSKVKMTLVVQSAYMGTSMNTTNYSAEFYVLIMFK